MLFDLYFFSEIQDQKLSFRFVLDWIQLHFNIFSDWKQLRLLVTSLFALGTFRCDSHDLSQVSSEALQSLVLLCDAGKSLSLGVGNASLFQWFNSGTCHNKLVAMSKVVASNLFRTLAASTR